VPRSLSLLKSFVWPSQRLKKAELEKALGRGNRDLVREGRIGKRGGLYFGLNTGHLNAKYAKKKYRRNSAGEKKRSEGGKKCTSKGKEGERGLPSMKKGRKFSLRAYNRKRLREKRVKNPERKKEAVGSKKRIDSKKLGGTKKLSPNS